MLLYLIRNRVTPLYLFWPFNSQRFTNRNTISLSEQEVNRSTFLQSLVSRGLSGVELIINDAHVGLQVARQAVFCGAPWQLCQFHLQQNESQYVPCQSMNREVATDILAIFDATNQAQAEAQLSKMVMINTPESKLVQRMDWVM